MFFAFPARDAVGQGPDWQDGGPLLRGEHVRGLHRPNPQHLAVAHQREGRRGIHARPYLCFYPYLGHSFLNAFWSKNHVETKKT